MPGRIAAEGARMIYKIMSTAEWTDAQRSRVFLGSAADRLDGFIHLSDVSQVRQTAARYFAGQDGLRLVSVSPDTLDIRWEPSRGGALFPHLYGPLPLSAVRAVHVLRLDAAGVHGFPADLA
ncbi:MAG: DUF952 domain-containing protein [Acidobacteriota bacterium]